MSRIVPGRMTHHYDGELVVFHIGMQINRWWRPDLWLPAFFAMPRMLKELSQDSESGFLGYELLFGGGGPYVVQYWDSIEKLYAYASAPAQEHRPAWTRFNRVARKAPGAVGVWHETFLVKAGQYEAIYSGMPAFGLGKVGRLTPASGARESARGRMSAPAASV